MMQSNWELADAIALELVGRETDVNEMLKVVTHVRNYVREHVRENPEQARKDFFTLLEMMVNEGRYLVRSGRTLDYYRDLRDVCGRHLRNFEMPPPDFAWELVDILTWAARLMRYYRSPEGKTELVSKQRGVVSGEILHDSAHAQPQPKPTQEEPRPKRPAPTLPNAPPRARPREETTREMVTLVSAIKSGKALVRTKKDEEVTCTGMPSYPRASTGEVCRADVTRENGRALKAMFKGWVS